MINRRFSLITMISAKADLKILSITSLRRPFTSSALQQQVAEHRIPESNNGAVSENINADISEQLRTVPKISGSGPFASEPEFQLLGSPFPNSLHVSLPSSSSLFLKNAAVVGITGDASKSNSTLEYTNAGAAIEEKTPFALPLVYQKVTASNPLTLLMSAPALKGKTSSYALISPSKSYNWIIKRDALLAWCGSQLSLRPALNSVLYEGSNPVVVSGENGHLAILADCTIYEFKLDKHEQVFLRPSSIIGLTVPYIPDQELPTRLLYRIPHLPLPSLTSFLPSFFHTLSPQLTSLLQNVNFIPQSIKSKLELLGQYGTWASNAVKAGISQVIWQDDVLVKVQGPATILLDHQPPSFVVNKLKSLNVN